MSEIRTKREQLREERRRQILDAALIVFARKGFHEANVTDIAAEAGVSQGTIYWYFDSKDALLQKLLVEGFEEMLQPYLQALADESLSPLERLRATFRQSLRTARASGEQLRLVFSLWSQPGLLPPEAYERIYQEHIFGRLAAVLRQAMEAGEIEAGDVEALTAVVAALMDGLILYTVMWPEALVSDERLEEAVLRMLVPTARAR